MSSSKTTRTGDLGQNFFEDITGASDSIELRMTAKGERVWDIKVYFEPGKEAAALGRLNYLEDELQQRYGPAKLGPLAVWPDNPA